MRTIKFRVYSPLDNQFIGYEVLIDGLWKLTNLGQTSWGKGKFENSKLIRVQFTGLLDKNGKEIYESDVLDCIYLFDGCKKHKLQVVWNNDRAGFVLKNLGKCHQPNVRKNMWDMDRSKIIGDIHSNPELLK